MNFFHIYRLFQLLLITTLTLFLLLFTATGCTILPTRRATFEKHPVSFCLFRLGKVEKQVDCIGIFTNEISKHETGDLFEEGTDLLRCIPPSSYENLIRVIADTCDQEEIDCSQEIKLFKGL